MYKKYTKIFGVPGGTITKLFLIMRLTTVILIATIMQVSASGLAQKISLFKSNAGLKSVLKELRIQSGYNFVYTDNLLRKSKPVSINVKDVLLKDVLDQIFLDQNLSYLIESKTIVIEPKEPSIADKIINMIKNIDVNGKIVDEKGEPIPGATIKVKGKKQFTVSAANGDFQIKNVEESAILEISYIGFATIEMGVRSDLGLITMKESNADLNEVIVVGYGTQKKKDVTGAVSTANLKTYENVPVNNILESVKGALPGLNVTSVNKAGEVSKISVRGKNSINAKSDPLIVVDGAIFNGSLNDIPAADIESFTVLKDASAAAVYGSRSANGVILIETKKGGGIDGKPKFAASINYGFSNELEHLKVYDAQGYIQRLMDIRQANGLEADPSKIAIYLQNEEQKNYNATPDHQPTLVDPYSIFRQSGQSLNASVSVSNKTDKTQYYISGNMIDQKGVVKDDLYKHYSARVNLETDLTSWLNVGVKSSYSLNSFPGSTIYGMSEGASASSPYAFSPYASLFAADGSYLQFPQTTTSFNSPYWQVADDKYDKQNNLNGILTARVKVPWVKGLSYNMTYSNTLKTNEMGKFYGLHTVIGSPKAGSGDQEYDRNYYNLLDHLIKYNSSFGKHNIDITALYSTENFSNIKLVTHGEGFDDTSLGIYGLGKAKLQTIDPKASKYNGVGQMARVTYNYDDRYTLTGTIRRDGFSAFSENQKYGTFPSVGANWNLSNESFMKGIRTIDHLALRVSYGTNGNQSIDPYTTLSKMGNGKYLFEGDKSYNPTQYVNVLGNSNLKWESVTGLNLGLDFAILKHRITGAIDWYSKHTRNLIFPQPIPTTSGFNEITSNLGKVGNKGIELSLSTVNIDRADFNWRSDFAFSLNRNKIISIYGKDKNGIEHDIVDKGYFIGKPLGTIYAYEVLGMWQQADVDNGTIMQGMKPGTYQLRDVDGDGKITSDKDRQFIGNANENFRWSFTNTFSYKDLSLMVYINSIWGGNGYYLSDKNAPYNDGFVNNGALNHPVYDYWTPANPNAMFPRPNYANAATYRGIKHFDRSFINCRSFH